MENETHMEEQILQADKLYMDGDYAECKRLLLDLLDQEPGFGRAHHLIGCLYFYVLDDQEKAVRHLELAVKFAPGYPAAYVNYARLLSCLGRRVALFELVKQAMKVEGMNRCVMLLEYGKSLEANGELNKARDCYFRAERYATADQELEVVKGSLKRIRRKKLGALRRMFLLP